MRFLQIRYSRINGGDYDAYYHKDPVRRGRVKAEDEAITDILDRLVEPGEEVIDFGCGDGLVHRLLRNCQPLAFYVGIDPDRGYKDPVTQWNPVLAPFRPDYIGTTRDYLDWCTGNNSGHADGVVVFCFSAEDSGWRNVIEAVCRADKALIIFYHKAWRTGINVVVNWLKFQLYYFPQARRLKRALEVMQIPVERLDGEDNYYVAIKDWRRRDRDGATDSPDPGAT
jgi:hypothetical protein